MGITMGNHCVTENSRGPSSHELQDPMCRTSACELNAIRENDKEGGCASWTERDRGIGEGR